MTLEEALNKSAKEVSCVAVINLIIQSGSCSAGAYHRDKGRFYPESIKKTLAEQVLECLKWCNGET